MIKINTSGDYVQLIYVDPVQESVQQELRSDTDAFECSYDSDGKLYMQFGAMRFENPDPTDFTINGVAVTDAADFISKLNALFTGGGGGSTIYTGDGSLSGNRTVDVNGHRFIISNGVTPLIDLDFDSVQTVIAATDNTAFTDLRLTGTPTNSKFEFLSSADGDNSVSIIGNGQTMTITNSAQIFEVEGINDGATLYAKFQDTPDNELISFYVQDLTGDGNITELEVASTIIQAKFDLRADFNDGAKRCRIIGMSNVSSANTTYVADNHTFVGINEFADDAAAAIGGVPVNGLYHTAGAVKIRLS